jgi:hypothetical protein
MSGHRRAALTLHGLQAQDKQWLLTQLPAQDQTILREHLQELDALGFRYEPELIDQLPQQVEQHAALAPNPATLTKTPLQSNGAPDPASAAMSTIASADAGQIWLLVQDEPLAWLARLLACQHWPWQADLLAQLPPPTRQRLRALSVPAAPKLDQSLLLVLQQALINAPAPAPVSKPLVRRRSWPWSVWWRR